MMSELSMSDFFVSFFCWIKKKAALCLHLYIYLLLNMLERDEVIDFAAYCENCDDV